MKRSCLSCSAALALAALVCSCYSYKTVRVAVRVSAVEEEIPGRIARKTSDQGLRRRDAARSHTVYIRRYCATGVSAGPLEAINSRGVQSITAGRLGEAEILFNELVRENAPPPIRVMAVLAVPLASTNARVGFLPLTKASQANKAFPADSVAKPRLPDVADAPR